MEKVYVVLYRTKLDPFAEEDHIEIKSVHRTKEGAIKYIKEELWEDWEEKSPCTPKGTFPYYDSCYEILEFELKD